jgi:PadR family transcriptional regulator AphA
VAGHRAELSPTEGALLAVLAGGEQSGYDLARRFERGVGRVWSPAKGHLYVVLPRLVERGWATSREVVEGKRPQKTLYRITRKGRSALARWVDEPIEPEPDRNMFLVKLFFGDLTSKASMLEHVRRRRDDAAELRAQIEELQRLADASGEPQGVYPWLTRRYGLMWARMVIRWSEEAEEAISVARATPGTRFLRRKKN